jgi:hypothetical protein
VGHSIFELAFDVLEEGMVGQLVDDFGRALGEGGAVAGQAGSDEAGGWWQQAEVVLYAVEVRQRFIIYSV